MNTYSVGQAVLKPWMVRTHGWVLCLMCPTGKTTHKGKVQYFLGVRPNKATRKRLANWLNTHRRCGFEVVK